MAAFADLQVGCFAGAWPEYPPGWVPQAVLPVRRLEAGPSPAAKDASLVPLSLPKRLGRATSENNLVKNLRIVSRSALSYLTSESCALTLRFLI